MREKLQRFMAGRYGTDQLSRVYLALTLVCLLLSMFTGFLPFYLVAILLLIYTYYRMFTRKVEKMAAQNQKFLNWRYRRAAKWASFKKRLSQRREYRFYKCPTCRQRVRVPRGKGKICITCPRCHREFIKKS